MSEPTKTRRRSRKQITLSPDNRQKAPNDKVTSDTTHWDPSIQWSIHQPKKAGNRGHANLPARHVLICRTSRIQGSLAS